MITPHSNNSIDTQNPEHHESFFNRIFDHHGHKQENDPKKVEHDEGNHEHRFHDTLKKDERGLKEYLKEDEELEQEGQTYGGLM